MKWLLRLLVLALPLWLCSCDEDNSVTDSYKYTLSTFFSNSEQDLATVSSYLASQGISLDKAFYITGRSEAENREQALAIFRATILLVTVDEIGDLGLDNGTYFTLSLISHPDNPAEVRTIATYSYPEEERS